MDYEATARPRSQAWLTDSVFASSAPAYSSYLTGRGYSRSSVRIYVCCVAHFAHWLKERRITLDQVDEALVDHFLDDHLPQCRCARRVQRCRCLIRAALRQLLIVLRMRADIPDARDFTPRPIHDQLKQFDAHLDQVCGLAISTRNRWSGVVRTFLMDLFGTSEINLAEVNPDQVYRFVINHVAGHAPNTGKIIGSALRSYLRFRGMRGDHVVSLIAAIPCVAKWRLASMPDVLSDTEVDRLLDAFDRQSATGRRDYAMARCLVDLGLRSCEVAQLQLDDMNWRDGTILLAVSKARRADVLPLPAQTGNAIADYLINGRPAFNSRAVFLRHVAPLTKPVGPGIVRNAIRRAYERCGLATRWNGTHVLRHSFASRLLQAGTPMKEIADILRHRSLDTTAIYAKIDTSRLASIARPWPGRES